MNARQQEYFEQQQNMLREAILWAINENPDNPYEVEIPKEAFLARFTMFHHAGYYARERYFKDFMTFGVFSAVYDKNTPKPKEGVFQLSQKELESVSKQYDLPAPKIKPQPQIPTQ